MLVFAILQYLFVIKFHKNEIPGSRQWPKSVYPTTIIISRLSLTFKTGPDTVTFTGKIYSIDRPKSEFSSGRHGVAIPLDSIMEYYDVHKKRYVNLDKISFTLTISNILLKDTGGKSDPESGVEDIDWILIVFKYIVQYAEANFSGCVYTATCKIRFSILYNNAQVSIILGY